MLYRAFDAAIRGNYDGIDLVDWPWLSLTEAITGCARDEVTGLLVELGSKPYWLLGVRPIACD